MSVLVWIAVAIYTPFALIGTLSSVKKSNGSTVMAVGALVGILLNVFIIAVMVAAALTLQGAGL